MTTEDYAVIAEQSLTEPRRVNVGWDGRSNPITELWYPCGCHKLLDGRTLVKSCTTHLSESVREHTRYREEYTLTGRPIFP